MHVHWMATVIGVVDYDLDDIIVVNDLGACVFSVDDWVGGCFAHTHDCVQRGHFGLDVADVVDSEAEAFC